MTGIEQTLFHGAGALEADLGRTGGLQVAAEETFSAAVRIRLDETSWVDHVPGWLPSDGELMDMLMHQAQWEQRSRWMYTRRATESRLTAEYPVSLTPRSRCCITLPRSCRRITGVPTRGCG